MLLGYSAAGQGRPAEAERLFEAAVDVEVPPRTHSPNRTVEARVAFRRGDRPRAFRILRGHVEDLLDSDNMQGACVASVEFVSMLSGSGRRAEAAPILAYLNESGLLDVAVWRAQVAGLGEVPAKAGQATLDDRGALEYKRALLSRSPSHPGDVDLGGRGPR
jgi:hypothetical protein